MYMVFNDLRRTMKSWKETKENLEGSGTIFKLYLNSETFKKFFTWVHTKTWNTPK